MTTPEQDTHTAFVPPGSMVVGFVPPGGGSFGFVAPGGGPMGFVAPGGGPLGIASPNVVVLGYVGPNGTILGLQGQPQPTQATSLAPVTPTGSGNTIVIWEDDPATNVLAHRDIPDLVAARLAIDPASTVPVLAAAPAPGQYPPHTTEFRYWTAAEALARGTGLWHAIIAKAAPGRAWQWHNMATLPVMLDNPAPDFNAFYDRTALKFFHGDTSFGRVYSGESPDIVCHELGHAVLDAIKPQLWGAASHEAAAFHEAFGDISALLSALQLPSLRSAVLHDTGGRLYTNSRLSRLAEQLGAAIRLSQPQDVDPDCLRNAVNSFVYHDPTGLQPSAPASQLSSEPHSFSRVFSGAFFEALATLVTAMATNPTDATLTTAADEMAIVLIRAILRAPIVSNLFAQVAAGMVVEAARFSPLHASIVRGVCVRRGILSPRSAASFAGPNLDRHLSMTADLDPRTDLGLVLVSASAYGIEKSLALESPSHHRAYAATSAAPDATPIEPSSALTAAKSFADDIFRRGRVDYAGHAGDTALLHIGNRFTTHKLVADDGAVRLTRCCFDCGLRRD